MTKAKNPEQNMTLLDHLIELRNRLLVSFCAFLFLFFLCFIKFTDNNQNLADLVYIFLQQLAYHRKNLTIYHMTLQWLFENLNK